MGYSYKDGAGYIGRGEYTGPEQPYVKFEMHCGGCRMLIFEFVHKQRPLSMDSRLLAQQEPNKPYGAQSWYKPAVRVVCAEGVHSFIPVKEGEDRNQICTSRAMTEKEFNDWYAPAWAEEKD